jgi:ligand-binding SRPBCC domain-containing protein
MTKAHTALFKHTHHSHHAPIARAWKFHEQQTELERITALEARVDALEQKISRLERVTLNGPEDEDA